MTSSRPNSQPSDLSPAADPATSQPGKDPQAQRQDSQDFSLFKSVTDFGAVLSYTAAQSSRALVDTAAGVGASMSHTAMQSGKNVVETAEGIGQAIVNTTAQTGKAAVETATVIGDFLGQAATQTGQSVLEATQQFGATAGQQTHQWAEQTAASAGKAVTVVSRNPIIRRTSGVLRLDWLTNLSDRVDLNKAEQEVRKLQQKYPDDSPSQISHRIMVKKAMHAGGIGFVSSILPGVAAALLAVDLAATTALQTEMVYQIAAAYGMDLNAPDRKGEVLGIFGLALGGSKALRAGLGFLRNVPMAGAMIGSSTNATMLYALGYAACRFYEAKLENPDLEPPEATLQTIQEESDRYLEVAISQQALMDQVLVHMVLARYPDKTWEDILPNLKKLQINPDSLKAIAAHLKAPKPLTALLDQLNPDFAVPLLAQCYRIAHTSEEMVAEEVTVLEAIASRFEIDLDEVKAVVASETRHS